MDYYEGFDEYLDDDGPGDYSSGSSDYLDYYEGFDEYLDQPEETEYHLMGALKSAGIRGAKALGGHLPSAIGTFIPGEDIFEKVGRENKAVYDRLLLKSEDVQEYNAAVAGKRESTWTEALGSVGETGAAVLVSAIPIVGRALSAGMFLDLNKEEIYNQAIEKGVDEDTAQLTSWVGGIVNSALDVFSISRGIMQSFTGGASLNITNFLLGAARNVLYEGSTEGLQEFVTELASEVGARREGETQEGYWARVYDRMPETWDRMKHAAVIGGIMGGGFHAVGSAGKAIRPLQEPKWEMLNKLEEDPSATPENIDKLIKSGWGADEGITKQELGELKKRKVKAATTVDPVGIQQAAVTGAERASLNDFEEAIMETERTDEDSQQFLAAMAEETRPERIETRQVMWEEAGLDLAGVAVQKETMPIEPPTELPVPSVMAEEAEIWRDVEEEYERTRKEEAQQKAGDLEGKFAKRAEPIEPTPGGGILEKAVGAVGGRVTVPVEQERMGKAQPKEIKARQKLLWEQKKTPMVEQHREAIDDFTGRDIRSIKKEELESFAEEMGVKATGTKSEILSRLESEIKKEGTRHAGRIRSATQGLSTAIGRRKEGIEKVDTGVEQKAPEVPAGEEAQAVSKKAPERAVKEKYPKTEGYAARHPARKTGHEPRREHPAATFERAAKERAEKAKKPPETKLAVERGGKFATVYHRSEVPLEGKYVGKENTGEMFVSNMKDGQNIGYGKHLTELRVKKSDLTLDDEFPSGEKHYTLPADKANKYMQAKKPPETKLAVGKYSLGKKVKKGDGFGFKILLGKKMVGHISGFEKTPSSKSDVVTDLGISQEPYFDMTKTEMDEGDRGGGLYQRSIQQVADQYPNGIITSKFQASIPLQKALRKIKGHVETGEGSLKGHIMIPRSSKVKPETKLAVWKFKPKTEHLRYDGSVDLGDGIQREQWTVVGLPEKEIKVAGVKLKLRRGGTFMGRKTLKGFGFKPKQFEAAKKEGPHRKGSASADKYASEFDKTTVVTKAIRAETGEEIEISQTAQAAISDTNSKLDILNELKGCL